MAVNLIHVRESEADHIRVRREAAKTLPATPESSTRQDSPQSTQQRTTIDKQVNGSPTVPERPAKVEEQLIGLALSGGGLRSASLSLGLVQSLHKHGLLRFVDYLSTVSGGGYLGSYLSSLVTRQAKPITETDFPLRPLNQGDRQPEQVLRFLYGGRYLNRPWLLLNKYLIGLFLINLAFISGLIALCSLLAYLGRLVDAESVRRYARALDLNYDAYIPLTFFLFFVMCWLIAWALSYYRRGAEAPGFWAQGWLVAMVVALLVGGALLMGNTEITLGAFDLFTDSNKAQPSRGLGRFLLVMIITGLLPLVNPRMLIESGMRAQKTWQRWVFNASCASLLVGVPVLVVAMIGQQGFGGLATDSRNENRFQIRSGEIYDWPAFSAIVTGSNDFKSPAPTAESTKASQNRPLVQDYSEELAHAFKVADTANKELRTANDAVQPLGHFARAAQLLTMAFDPNPVSEYIEAQELADVAKAEACRAFNLEVLCSQNLHKNLSKEWPPLPDTKTAFNNQTSDDQVWTSLQSSLDQILSFAQKTGKIDDAAVALKLLNDLPDIELAGGTSSMSDREVEEFNRRLLFSLYPNVFYNPNKYYRWLVYENDQQARWNWFCVALGIFAIGLLVDMNATSLHRFYRNELTRAFVVPKQSLSSDSDLDLSDLRTTDYGGPYHLISASIFMGERKRALDGGAISTPVGDVPVEPSALSQGSAGGHRIKDSFLFSRRFCGSQITGYIPTETYEKYLAKNISLGDAIALSGAAVDARQSNNLLMRTMMILLNLRLGQWLPNPSKGKPAIGPRVLSLIPNLWRAPEDQRYLYVSDGGYCENLGLVALLRRRCNLIIVLDSGCDPKHEFQDLANVLRTVRVHAGVEIVGLRPSSQSTGDDLLPLELARLALDAQGKSKHHFVAARILYPELESFDDQTKSKIIDRADHGLLIYVKASLDGDEGLDLLQYKVQESEFPHHATSDQLYDDVRVENYRRLGYHIGDKLCAVLFKNQRLWDVQKLDLNEIRDNLLKNASSAEPGEQPSPSAVEKHAQEVAKSLELLRESVQKISDVLSDRSSGEDRKHSKAADVIKQCADIFSARVDALLQENFDWRKSSEYRSLVDDVEGVKHKVNSVESLDQLIDRLVSRINSVLESSVEPERRALRVVLQNGVRTENSTHPQAAEHIASGDSPIIMMATTLSQLFEVSKVVLGSKPVNTPEVSTFRTVAEKVGALCGVSGATVTDSNGHPEQSEALVKITCEMAQAWKGLVN